MANQDYGAGQPYDQENITDPWTQQGRQQYDQSNEGRQGQEYDQGRQGRQFDQDMQGQQAGMGGVTQDPLMPDSPFDEEERPEEGMSRRDRLPQSDMDTAFGNQGDQ